MDCFVGLDVSAQDRALCVVDIEGAVLLQCEVSTELYLRLIIVRLPSLSF